MTLKELYEEAKALDEEWSVREDDAEDLFIVGPEFFRKAHEALKAHFASESL